MKEVRFILSDELYKEFKLVCLKNDLSVPKQLTSIVKSFIEMMNSTERLLEYSKNK